MLPWEAIGQVSGPFTLLAFALAVFLYIRRRRFLRDERLVEKIPPEERATTGDSILGRLRLGLNGVRWLGQLAS